MKITHPNARKVLLEAFNSHLRLSKKLLRKFTVEEQRKLDEEISMMRILIHEMDTWPTVSSVGKDATGYATVIVIAQDHDLAFQEWAFKQWSGFPKNEVDTQLLAHLEDRISVNKGIEQVYGTQFQIAGDGFVVGDIRDPINVNARRRLVGLPLVENQLQSLFEEPCNLHCWYHCLTIDRSK